jgi:DNA-directed RNA polymerase specialized sigma24 family protein
MSLGQELAPHLPFLRRYARALTGSQAHGDAFVRATLEAIVASPSDFPRDVDARLGLYRTFHAIWSSANIEEDPGHDGTEGAEGVAQARLAQITPLSRQALLLTAMEGFTPEDAGYLIGAEASEVDNLVAEALAEIERQTRAEVLIIEDEPIIAMDIETIVRDLGHTVITAFPERLLTGERPEPTFLITKPFQRSTVKAAIAQALFFDTATVPA